MADLTVRCRLAYTSLVVLAGASCAGNGEPGWQLVQDDLDGALMSVWAASPTDVWAVGADPGDGPVVLRYDGESWQREDTGLTGDLWWVHGFAGGPVFVGGEGGLIARYEDGAFAPMDTPGGGTVFGIWGATPSDMWAVGGNLGGADGAFAWRLQGDTWIPAEGFPTELADRNAVWKVFGRAPDDVWLVGTNGLVLHYDGETFTEEDPGVTTALFTVHATADRVFAVGGFGTGVVVERDAGGWEVITPEGAGQILGVYAVGEEAYAVGADGIVYRRAGGASDWEIEPTELDVFRTLHAVCIDAGGGVWAVGGQLQVAPFIDGVIVHKGDEIHGGTL